MVGIIEGLKEIRTEENADKIDDICETLNILMRGLEKESEGEDEQVYITARMAGVACAIYWAVTGNRLEHEKRLEEEAGL